MNGKWLFVPCIMIVLILLIGCGRQTQSPGGSGTVGSFFPHADGYSWTYTVIMTVETTWEVTTTLTDETYTFSGTTELSNGIIVQNYCLVGSSEAAYYYVDGSGVYRYGTSVDPTIEAETYLSFPLNVGNSWNTATSSSEVISYEAISVPAGDFSAYLVRRLGSAESYSWFALNVGKAEVYYKANGPMLVSVEGEFKVVPASVKILSELKSKNF